MTDENPIKPVTPAGFGKPKDGRGASPLNPKVTTVRVTRGRFMSDEDSGSAIFDPGQKTVTPGSRRKVGRFMEGYND